jgi:ABC-type transporter Mla MlaB component
MDEAREVKLSFSGELTTIYAETAHLRLKDALGKSSSIEIDCSGATEVDLSFVQLLLSVRKSGQLAGKSVRLSTPATGPLLEALRRGGLLGNSDAQQVSVWLTE